MIQKLTIMRLPQKPVLVIDFPNLRQLPSKEVGPLGNGSVGGNLREDPATTLPKMT